MKYIAKGLGLGASLVALHKLCHLLFSNLPAFMLEVGSCILFFAVIVAFLVSDKIEQLLICGFSGLFCMFAVEIATMQMTESFCPLDGEWLAIYVAGFFGSVAALIASCILTNKKIKLTTPFKKEAQTMSDIQTDVKYKLLIYAFISACSFSYLVMAEAAGISIFLFLLLQVVMLWFILPDKKRLFYCIPILLLSLQPFWSACDIWHGTNLLISAILLNCMFLRFDFKSDSLSFLTDTAKATLMPFTRFRLPFNWLGALSRGKDIILKRIILALAIAIPLTFVLTLILSSADMVFSLQIENLADRITDLFHPRTVYIVIAGIIAGLYLFGVLCHGYVKAQALTQKEPTTHTGDLLMINIVLSAVLFVYTAFVIVQFKYLFAGSALPEDLTYTTYARKGFFELLALTAVNIISILVVIRLSKNHISGWSVFTKILCHYLCAVTVVLLISSFYRMLLYTGDDGLTRLRLFVLGFLVFEGIGLLITFVYIAKPKFNITLIYTVLALSYYLLLNLVPTDYIIAKNQIEKYLAKERNDITYVLSLSADASPAVAELLTKGSEVDKQNVLNFLNQKMNEHPTENWRQYNLSIAKTKDIAKQLISK